VHEIGLGQLLRVLGRIGIRVLDPAITLEPGLIYRRQIGCIRALLMARGS